MDRWLRQHLPRRLVAVIQSDDRNIEILGGDRACQSRDAAGRAAALGLEIGDGVDDFQEQKVESGNRNRKSLTAKSTENTRFL